MAKDVFEDLTKAAAQFMAIRAASHVGGGGLTGFLLSSIAMKGVDRVFDKPKDDKAKTNAAGTSETGPEDVGRRIGDAAAEAIKRILDEQFAKSNPQGQAVANPTAKPDAVGDASTEPSDPESGRTRLYHGGHDPATGGGRWVSQQKDYAEGYARKSGGQLHYTDLPDDHPLLKANKAFDDSGTPMRAPISNFELPEDLAKKLKPFNSVGGQTTTASSPAPSAPAPASGVQAAPAAAAGGRAAPAAAAGAAAPAGGATGAAAGGAGAVAAPVAAAVILATALYEGAKAARDLAYAQEKESRRIGEVNPTIAGQNAELDFNRVMRDMQSGDRLAGSNAQNLGAIDRFEKALRPFEDLASTVKNLVASDVLNGMANTLDLIRIMGTNQYDALVQLVRLLSMGNVKLPLAKDVLKEDSAPDGQGFGDFLKHIQEREEEKRRQEAERKKGMRRAMNDARSW